MHKDFDKRIYRILLTAVVFVLLVGVIVYHFVEHFSWLNAYFFSVTTLSTVGYGDLVPHTAFGKIFTTFYIFAGVGIFTAFVTYALRRRGSRFKKD